MKHYPTNLTDSQWMLLSGILNDNRKRKHSLRDIFNAIFYLIKTGCQWRMMPCCFPNWELVYYYFTKWKNNGVIEQVHELLRDKIRKKAGKYESPRLACIDSQSIKTTELCAELNVFVPGRMLDDDGAVLLRFDSGAKGVLIATQIAAGEENALKIRVYGDKGGLEWAQHEPNTLIAKWTNKPTEIYRVGTSMGAAAAANTLTPGGHPEGYLEAFANIYRNFSHTLRARMNGEHPKPEWLDFPGVEDGIRGMHFIDKVVAAGYNDRIKWVKF